MTSFEVMQKCPTLGGDEVQATLIRLVESGTIVKQRRGDAFKYFLPHSTARKG